jgi:hypothetical protein
LTIIFKNVINMNISDFSKAKGIKMDKIVKCSGCGNESTFVYKCNSCGETRCFFPLCKGDKNSNKEGDAKTGSPCLNCGKGIYEKISQDGKSC